jgi:hypothetical protein
MIMPGWNILRAQETSMLYRAVTMAVLLSIGAADAFAQRGARPISKHASIAGRVIHADGAAAEGARVAVYALREGAPASIVGTAVSAYDGRYEVGGLPAGEYAVGVTPQRLRGFGGDSRRLTSPPVETLYPGTTDRMKARPVTVFNGVATEGIDIWLEPAAQRYAISGRVTWPEGLDPTSLVIEFGGPDAVHKGIWYVHDPGGLFTIEGASRGTYVLLARGETHTGPLVGVAATDVFNDSVHDVRLALRSPGAIEGRLILEGGAPPDVGNLRITATQKLLTLSPLYPPDEAALNSAGQFTLPNLLGEYTLTVAGLPAGWRIRRVTRTGAALPDQRIAVPAGERVTGIEVVVGPGR